MADRFDFYFRQLVTEAELDAAFAALELAEQKIQSDNAIIGVTSGGAVTEASPADLTVDVAAGVCYDSSGQRIAWAGTQEVDLSVDADAVPTAVGTPGNSKILSIFASYSRDLTDPRTDGVGATVFYDRAESFELIVRQGVEGVGPTAPALEAGKVLLADITIDEGQTTILTADIDQTTRRQWAFKLVASGATTIAVGTVEEAAQGILTQLGTYITALAAAGGAALVGAPALLTALLATTVTNQIKALWRRARLTALLTLRGVPSVQTVGTDEISGLALGGTLPLIVAADGTSLMWSTDGEAWTRGSGTMPGGSGDVVWGAADALFVAVQGNDISSSPDGKVWTSRTPALDGGAAQGQVAYGAGVFVANGYNSGEILSGNIRLQSSPDAITWTERTNPSGNWLTFVTFAGAKFIAGGDQTLITSADGITWVDRSGFLPADCIVSAVCYDAVAALWVAAATNSSTGVAMILTTTNPDSVAWTNRTANVVGLPATTTAYGIVYCGNGIVVATYNDVAQRDQVIVSFDGFLTAAASTFKTVDLTGASGPNVLRPYFFNGRLMIGGRTLGSDAELFVGLYDHESAL